MTDYFTHITDFIAAHPHYAVTAVFLLALSEAVPLVGIVVPGSTLIIAISALATSAEINPWPLLVAAVAGAIVGDGFSFWLGQDTIGKFCRFGRCDDTRNLSTAARPSSNDTAAAVFFSLVSPRWCAPLCRWSLAFYKCRRANFILPMFYRPLPGRRHTCFQECFLLSQSS